MSLAIVQYNNYKGNIIFIWGKLESCSVRSTHTSMQHARVGSLVAWQWDRLHEKHRKRNNAVLAQVENTISETHKAKWATRLRPLLNVLAVWTMLRLGR